MTEQSEAQRARNRLGFQSMIGNAEGVKKARAELEAANLRAAIEQALEKGLLNAADRTTLAELLTSGAA